MSVPGLSIVLPCYNPPPNWQEYVIASLKAFEVYCPDYELIVVNDGCHSDTVRDISLLRTQVKALNWISYPENRGKGYAIRQGVAAARAELVIYTDIDFPYTVGSLQTIYQALSSGTTDIAVGIKDAAYYEKVPAFRRWLSRSLTRMIRLLVRISITDTQCGLKGLNAVAKPLLLSGTIDRYLFDLEFIYRAERKGLRLRPIPVRLREGVVFSSVNWTIIAGELRNFMKILRRR